MRDDENHSGISRRSLIALGAGGAAATGAALLGGAPAVAAPAASPLLLSKPDKLGAPPVVIHPPGGAYRV
jgi:hypothetical protein